MRKENQISSFWQQVVATVTIHCDRIQSSFRICLCSSASVVQDNLSYDLRHITRMLRSTESIKRELRWLRGRERIEFHTILVAIVITTLVRLRLTHSIESRRHWLQTLSLLFYTPNRLKWNEWAKKMSVKMRRLSAKTNMNTSSRILMNLQNSLVRLFDDYGSLIAQMDFWHFATSSRLYEQENLILDEPEKREVLASNRLIMNSKAIHSHLLASCLSFVSVTSFS